MHTDWETPYQVAMRELNDMKLEGLYEQARHAIHNRGLELREDGADTRERRALDDAMRQLIIHKYRVTLVR